jgi:hypothetical protein
MEIRYLPNGYEIEKHSFFRRMKGYAFTVIWLFVCGFIGGLLNGYLAETLILFGIIFLWHFQEWLSFYRFQLKSILFLDDCVKVEYFDHNKLRQFTSDYKDLSITQATLWYKTRNKREHLIFKWKGEMVFRQFCYNGINQAFLQALLHKYHAFRSENQ